jgi:hypothetical protein
MEWMLAVLVLVLLWWYLRRRRPPPVEPKPLPDPRQLLAEELGRSAQTAREEGRHEEAQLLALRSAWLNTSPKMGDDTPPSRLNPDDSRHLRFAGDLWAGYRSTLALKDQAEHAESKPTFVLPYPKESIVRALDMLIDIGDGRVTSVHVDPSQISQDVLHEMKHARDELDRTDPGWPNEERV